MKKRLLLLYTCLITCLIIIAGCQASPEEIPPLQHSDESSNEQDPSSDDTTNSSDNDASDTTEMNFTSVFGLDDISLGSISLEDETIGAYHDDLSMPSPDSIPVDQEMLMDHPELTPFIQDLAMHPYNMNSGQVGIVADPSSIFIVASKLSKLPDGYEPDDLTEPDIPFYFEEYMEKRNLREVAAHALEDLVNGALEEDIHILGASGYRSYERQESIYANNVSNRGQEATDKISSRPGHSEHQTGLAMDVTTASVNYSLQESLGDQPEGQWLAEHAHEYGFIIRYPEGKSSITGYSYEPWHLRYVGIDTATFLYENNLTYEELIIATQAILEDVLKP